MRALTCTAKTPIGRFDTVAKIKNKVTDLECFQKQDVRLAEWISLRRLALAIAKPVLFPLTDLPAKALLPNYSESNGQVATALAANVKVVKVAQKFNVMQLPTGKQLGSFPVPEQSYRPATLSANGRVLAVPVGSRNLPMIEVAPPCQNDLLHLPPELLWQVLTAKRWELLKALCGAGPISIREAARRVERDVKAVHSDITALLNAGVVDRAEGGGIVFPFQAIKVEFLLQAA